VEAGGSFLCSLRRPWRRLSLYVLAGDARRRGRRLEHLSAVTRFHLLTKSCGVKGGMMGAGPYSLCRADFFRYKDTGKYPPGQ
jgi:hypothetical protein